MGLVMSSVLDAAVDEVFAWHARPGAFTRLAPPWQPVRVVSEADSLRDGRAVLGLPGGLRWTATHQPAGYRPDRSFVDSLDTGLLSTVLTWRHTHEFEPEDGDRTRMTDRVDTPVPAALLRSMFAYRHRQLADDLAAHAWVRELRPEPLTVAVTGAGGFVGTALCALLTTGGHRVIRLVRGGARSADERRWRPEAPAEDLLAGVDALVHLAGEPIAGRFTDEHKAAVRDSRIDPTRRLAELVAAAGVPVMVSASAIGFYGADRGDTELTEASGRGDGFLADLVADWEDATGPAADGGARVVRVRTGIVQSPRGGTLRLMYPLFAAGLGGRLGDGRQWLSWIGHDDLCDVYLRALVDERVAGPVNAVAPTPVRNVDYTVALASALRRPAVLPVPSFGPRLLLGEEGTRELALADQRVVPAVLAGVGHRFRHAEVGAALRHVLGKPPG